MKDETINRELLKQKAETLQESEVEEVLEYIEIMETLREQRIVPDPLDEAILKLLSESMRDPLTQARRVHAGRNSVKN